MKFESRENTETENTQDGETKHKARYYDTGLSVVSITNRDPNPHFFFKKKHNHKKRKEKNHIRIYTIQGSKIVRGGETVDRRTGRQNNNNTHFTIIRKQKTKPIPRIKKTPRL